MLSITPGPKHPPEQSGQVGICARPGDSWPLCEPWMCSALSPLPKYNKPVPRTAVLLRVKQIHWNPCTHCVYTHSPPPPNPRPPWQSGEAYGLLSQNNVFIYIEKHT